MLSAKPSKGLLSVVLAFGLGFGSFGCGFAVLVVGFVTWNCVCQTLSFLSPKFEEGYALLREPWVVFDPLVLAYNKSSKKKTLRSVGS